MAGHRAGNPLQILINKAVRDRFMKAKTHHRKNHKWRKRADSSPVAKGRRRKLQGTRNPRKRKHIGGKGL
jgi:hypothetical protein